MQIQIHSVLKFRSSRFLDLPPYWFFKNLEKKPIFFSSSYFYSHKDRTSYFAFRNESRFTGLQNYKNPEKRSDNQNFILAIAKSKLRTQRKRYHNSNFIFSTIPFSQKKNSFESVYSPLISFTLPDFLSIQRSSFKEFLETKFIEEFGKYNPIRYGQIEISFFTEYYRLKQPKYTPKTAVLKRKSYTASVYIPVQLLNHGTGERKWKWLFIVNLPLMTKHGHFIFNGSPRVLMNQMIRSPGVYFQKIDKPAKKSIFCADFIAKRGAWLRLEADTKKGEIWAKLKRVPKIPLVVFLRDLKLENRFFEMFIDSSRFYYLSRIRENLPIWHERLKTGYRILYNAPYRGDYQKPFFSSLARDSFNSNYLYKKEKTNRLSHLIPLTQLKRINEKLERLVDNKQSTFTSQKIKISTFPKIEENVVKVASKTKKPPRLISRKSFIRQFLNPRTYDLSLVGRSRINKRLGISIPLDHTTLTANDVFVASLVLLNILEGQIAPDDIDSLKNRKIQPCGDLLQTQLGIGLRDFEKKIFEKLNQNLHSQQDPFRQLFNTQPINQLFRTFFGTNPLSQFMDQTNALSEITHKRRLSSLGPGGINRDAAGMAIRGIHPTHYGRICPIETPEGQNAGLVNSVTIYSSLNHQGFIETPFYEAYKGFILRNKEPFLFLAEQEKTNVLAPGDIKFSRFHFLPKDIPLPSRQDKQFKRVLRENVNYIAMSPIQMISIATSLIPFLEHDDGNRALMGSNMQRQAVPTLRPTKPIVGTGLESRVVSDVRHGLETKKSGFISYIDSRQIIIYSEKPELKNLFFEKTWQKKSNLELKFSVQNERIENQSRFKKRIVEISQTFNSFDFFYKSRESKKKKNFSPFLEKRMIPSLVFDSFPAQTKKKQSYNFGDPKIEFSGSILPLSQRFYSLKKLKLNRFNSNSFSLIYKQFFLKDLLGQRELLRLFHIFLFDHSLKWLQLFWDEELILAYSQKLSSILSTKLESSFSTLKTQKDLPIKIPKTNYLRFRNRHFDLFQNQSKNPFWLNSFSYYYFSLFFLPFFSQKKGNLSPKIDRKNQYFILGQTFLNKKKVNLKLPLTETLNQNQFPFFLIDKAISNSKGKTGNQKKRFSYFQQNIKIFPFPIKLEPLFPSSGQMTSEKYSKIMKNWPLQRQFQNQKYFRENEIKFDSANSAILFSSLSSPFASRAKIKGNSKELTKFFHSDYLNPLKISPKSLNTLLKTGSDLKGFSHDSNWDLTLPVNMESPNSFQKKAFFDTLAPEIYSLNNYQRSNQDTYIVHRPVVRESQWIEKGDILADGSSSHQGELAIGQNILVGYTPWQGYNFEDAVLISERLNYDDLYTSLHIERYEVEVRDTEWGMESITNEVPAKLEARRILDENGLIKVGEWVCEGDILVGKVAPIDEKKISPYERLLYAIVGKEIPEVQDTSFRVPKGVSGRILHTEILKSSKKKKDLSPGKSKIIKKGKTNLFSSTDFNSLTPLSSSKGGKKKNKINRIQTALAIKKLTKQKKIENRVIQTSQKSFYLPTLVDSPFIASVEQLKEKQKKNKINKISRELNSISDLRLGLNQKIEKERPYFDVLNQKMKIHQRILQIKAHFISKHSNRFEKSFQKRLAFFQKAPHLFYSIRSVKSFQSSSIFQSAFSESLNPFVESSSNSLSFFINFNAWLNNKEGNEKTTKENRRIPSSLIPVKFCLFNRKRSPFLKTTSTSFFKVPSSLTKSGQEKKPNSIFTKQTKLNKNKNKQKKTTPQAYFSSPIKVQILIAEKKNFQVGDKIAGRHGNKGIISNIIPRQDMPYLPDGTPLDIVLNPLGVPSRMNVGQIFECLLGFAGYYLKQNFKIRPFDEIYGCEASRSLVYSKLYEARLKTGQEWLFNPNFPGKVRLFDGRSGECFEQPVTVGVAYILKLVHLVDHKIHARSTGPYSLVTQQPLRGRSKHGGQRVGEMEVWALEGFGAAYSLQEILTIKSDDLRGRRQLTKSIVRNQSIPFNIPESFNVLVRELKSLCLDVCLSWRSQQ